MCAIIGKYHYDISLLWCDIIDSQDNGLTTNTLSRCEALHLIGWAQSDNGTNAILYQMFDLPSCNAFSVAMRTGWDNMILYSDM